MKRTHAALLRSFLLLCCAWICATLTAQDQAVDPAGCLPLDFRIYFEVRDMGRLLDAATHEAVWRGAPAETLAVLRPLTAIAAWKPRRVVLGAEAGAQKPWILLVEAEDRDATAKALKELTKSGETAAFKFGPFAGVCDGSKTLENLQAVAAGKADGLLKSKGFDAARERNAGAAAYMHVNLAGTRWLRGAIAKPKDVGQAFFAAHVLSAAATADALDVRLDFHPAGELRLRARASIKPLPEARVFAAPPKKPGDPEPPSLASPPGTALRLSLRRDAAAFWSRKDEFVAEDARPAVAEFRNNLSILLGGLSAEEIFAGLGSSLDFYVGPPPSESPPPRHRLPTAAAVVRVPDPALRTELLLGFQTTLGVVNAQAAADRKPRYLIETTERHGVRIASARYLPEQLPDADDDRLQLRPALAFVGDRMILGTHPDLVMALIDEAVQKHEAPRAEGDALTIDGGAAAALLRAAAPFLVAREAAEKGGDAAASAAGLEFVAGLVARIASLSVALVMTGPEARLTLDLHAPGFYPPATEARK